jgi:hypothetical protein
MESVTGDSVRVTMERKIYEKLDVIGFNDVYLCRLGYC